MPSFKVQDSKTAMFSCYCSLFVGGGRVFIGTAGHIIVNVNGEMI